MILNGKSRLCTRAPSTAIAVPLPLGGRLLRAVPLRIVGSGFCPMVRGLPRAMLALALDASVGKVETYASTIGCVVFEKQVIALLCRVWYN